MLLVADVRKERRTKDEGERSADLLAWVNRIRSDVPAITHVDGSARIQTVSKETNPRYHALISAFERLTDVPILLNTSFNENEPIVMTPAHAIETFQKTRMDMLVLGNHVVRRAT